MNKKNVIHILVDALSFDNVGARDFKNTPTPFVDTLKKKSLSCERLYTQGPYIEAAFISGFCGENTLDHGGYMLGLSRCKNTFPSIYKENGYRTLSTFSPYISASSYIKDVDEYYYSRMYSLTPLILYRFNHFLTKFREHTMSESEYEVCVELLDDAFQIWIDQLQSIQKDDSSVCMMRDLINDINRVNVVLAEVNYEYSCFEKNKKKYIETLFENWDNHPLLKIMNLTINSKQTISTKQFIKTNFEDKIQKIQTVHNTYNKRNNKVDWKYLMNLTNNDEEGWRAARHTYQAYKNCFENNEIIDHINKCMDEEKVTISAHRQLTHFKDRIIELDQKGDNFYCFIHLEDFHLPSMFFSYDINDCTILEEELSYAYQYVIDLPTNYKGNLLADLSAHYLDKKLSEFFNAIKESLKNDYLIVITADHGYPCNYNPPRPLIYNSFYQENYHIPLIIFDSTEQKYQMIKGLYSSLDIMPTLIFKSGISKKYDLSTYLIDDENSRNYVLIEYPGPGCPEINTKQIYYAIYDGKYKIGFKEYLNNDITYSSLNGIFDLLDDPYEYVNMRKKLKNDIRIIQLIEIVGDRHKEIRAKFGNSKFYKALLCEKN